MGPFNIGEPCHPNGLAINPTTQKAVLANRGRNSHCVVWDLAQGKLDAVVDQTGGGDGVVYDAVDRAHTLFYVPTVIEGLPAFLGFPLPTV